MAYLVRASAKDPEVTLVSATSISEFSPISDRQALSQLAEFFAAGSRQHGVRWLKSNRIELP
ncbi:hypothetical protein [Hydrocarboniphaga sp.]|uniref:hypothetical protein n=1 Tax=Hydrocarboniphaga sp. TaxID=2033016 RepID=UPI003D0B3428